jgi:signal recognition particle GTPase
MVLAQLGGSITRALAQMSNATVIDEKVLNDCLNEISRALLQSDVQFKMVRDMQTNIKASSTSRRSPPGPTSAASCSRSGPKPVDLRRSVCFRFGGNRAPC